MIICQMSLLQIRFNLYSALNENKLVFKSSLIWLTQWLLIALVIELGYLYPTVECILFVCMYCYDHTWTVLITGLPYTL